MNDEISLLTRLYLLTLWHRLTIRSHSPDFILLVWRWECRGCTFVRQYDH
jgi:hypothetical protein